jgi:hypothetical protein
MARRFSFDTVESLNVTLQNLEQGAGAAFDRSDMAELKRAILTRIAELEIQALASAPASYVATSQFPNEPVVLPYAALRGLVFALLFEFSAVVAIAICVRLGGHFL